MTPHFDDLVIGGVMLAPILSYAGLAVLIMLLLRPLLRRIGFIRAFASPPIAEFSLFVSVFALLTLLT